MLARLRWRLALMFHALALHMDDGIYLCECGDCDEDDGRYMVCLAWVVRTPKAL